MNTSYNTRSNQFKIYIYIRNLTRLQQDQLVFSQRIINEWNSLPHEVATSSSFKTNLYNE